MGGIFKKQISNPSIAYAERNRNFTIIKNFEKKQMIESLFLSELYYLYRILKLCLSLKFMNIYLLSKGHFEFWNNIEKCIKKRKIIQKNRKLNDNELKKEGIFVNLYNSIKEEKRLR